MEEMQFELYHHNENWLDIYQWGDTLELTRNQVEQLIPALQFWLDNHKLPPQE